MASRRAWTALFILLLLPLVAGAGLLAADAAGNPNVPGAAEDGYEVAPEPELNETEIEKSVHDRVNEIRTQRELQPLEYNHDAAVRADDHAASMANRTELYHKDSEYYRCEPGANTAYTFAFAEYDTHDGGVRSNDWNETKIGRGLVQSWMTSPPHREWIVHDGAVSEGVGIAMVEVEGATRVYAAQPICVP